MAFESLATPLGVKPKAAGKPKGLAARRVLLAFVCAGIAVFLTYAAIQSSRRAACRSLWCRSSATRRRRPTMRRVRRWRAEARRTCAEGNRSSAQQIETESGVRVVRQNGGQAPGASVIRVPDAAPPPEANRFALAPAPDPRVTERIPSACCRRSARMEPRHAQLYARPFAATGKPRIAVVLTGVGVSARSTTDAITRLPGEFTLAFAPYGRDLEAQVMRARRDGHEILLQVPWSRSISPIAIPARTPCAPAARPRTISSGFTG